MKNRNLKLTGTDCIQGGDFRNVLVFDKGCISGDVQCNALICRGHSEVNGVDGNVHTSFMKVHGSSHVKGNLKTKILKVWGGSVVDGNCSCEEIVVRGGIDVNGLLTAENFYVWMFWNTKVKDIRGTTISVRRLNPVISTLKNYFRYFESSTPPFLTADSIEGDKVYLEYTRARLVRGTDIVIGPGCEIETIEYQRGLNQDITSEIHHSRKL